MFHYISVVLIPPHVLHEAIYLFYLKYCGDHLLWRKLSETGTDNDRIPASMIVRSVEQTVVYHLPYKPFNLYDVKVQWVMLGYPRLPTGPASWDSLK